MPSHFEQVARAAGFIRASLKQPPRAGLILGTGLGAAISLFEIEAAVEYRQIPHFPLSTVISHAGRIVSGRWAGCPVIIFQGRFHLYEGYNPTEVIFPIRVLQALGVTNLILTNAAGGLNPHFRVGDLMVITDHINLTGENPLIGANDERWGPRFPGMVNAYAPELIGSVTRTACAAAIDLQRGVYAGLKGPSLETPAEMRYLRVIGADAVGFSTVMESIAAVHAAMRVVGLSTITNMCLPDAPRQTDVADIIATAEKAAPRLAQLISGILTELAAG